MNFSFNRPTTQAAPTSRAAPRAPSVPGTLDFSLAPKAGATDNTPFSLIAGANLGPDWRNQLSAWVRAHAYYPEQAAMNDEDGDVTVKVVARSDGHVTSVELEHRLLSRWLDLALLSLFRDANLPPLHQEDGITFRFTMHYILIRAQ
jgi:TonB family protein